MVKYTLNGSTGSLRHHLVHEHNVKQGNLRSHTLFQQNLKSSTQNANDEEYLLFQTIRLIQIQKAI
jgi:hypothetical protein